MVKYALELRVIFCIKNCSTSSRKRVENRLRLFGYVERSPIGSMLMRVNQMKRSQTLKGRGRPKKTIREVDRTLWRKLNRNMIEHYGGN